jgi:hypothetical protein
MVIVMPHGDRVEAPLDASPIRFSGLDSTPHGTVRKPVGEECERSSRDLHREHPPEECPRRSEPDEQAVQEHQEENRCPLGSRKTPQDSVVTEVGSEPPQGQQHPRPAMHPAMGVRRTHRCAVVQPARTGMEGAREARKKATDPADRVVEPPMLADVSMQGVVRQRVDQQGGKDRRREVNPKRESAGAPKECSAPRHREADQQHQYVR